MATRSKVACLLGFRVRFPLATWMSVSFECCILLGIGLCSGLITHSESYREWCVCVWKWNPDNEEVLTHWRSSRHEKKPVVNWSRSFNNFVVHFSRFPSRVLEFESHSQHKYLLKRTALFRAFTQRVVAIPYHLLRFPNLDDGTDRMSRNVVKKFPLPAA
jgi:hypothetical protein